MPKALSLVTMIMMKGTSTCHLWSFQPLSSPSLSLSTAAFVATALAATPRLLCPQPACIFPALPRQAIDTYGQVE